MRLHANGPHEVIFHSPVVSAALDDHGRSQPPAHPHHPHGLLPLRKVGRSNETTTVEEVGKRGGGTVNEVVEEERRVGRSNEITTVKEVVEEGWKRGQIRTAGDRLSAGRRSIKLPPNLFERDIMGRFFTRAVLISEEEKRHKTALKTLIPLRGRRLAHLDAHAVRRRRERHQNYHQSSSPLHINHARPRHHHHQSIVNLQSSGRALLNERWGRCNCGSCCCSDRLVPRQNTLSKPPRSLELRLWLCVLHI
jgi:hypothetical protein